MAPYASFEREGMPVCVTDMEEPDWKRTVLKAGGSYVEVDYTKAAELREQIAQRRALEDKVKAAE